MWWGLWLCVLLCVDEAWASAGDRWRVLVPLSCAFAGLIVAAILMFLFYHFFVKRLLAERLAGGPQQQHQFKTAPAVRDAYGAAPESRGVSFSYDKEPVTLSNSMTTYSAHSTPIPAPPQPYTQSYGSAV